ncbi:MAG TPA: MBOAT family protein [Pseudomonadales bacterium]|nr:MBOAT family protein [Pseudomonadales bacterium]
MLFNSFAFIFAFLPITALGYELLRRRQLQREKKIWLIAASCVFYAYWSAAFLALLFMSIVVNFFVGRRLQSMARERGSSSRGLLIIGLVWNLSLLGYFKYANFFIDNFDAAFGLHFEIARIVLPLGISFFTFQKVAFLVDSYRNKVEPHTFVDFALFVMFFPQLIAGPIVHFGEVLPQFSRAETPPAADRYAIGITVFAIGLAKKVLVADTFAIHAGAFFDAAARGYTPGILEAWIGMLCYTLQIYFDFSGYSDMAIGLGWMFGVRLPINFASPYKAQSIAEYWQRWHVTLSRFLRDYVYIPLGGNRHGPTRQNVNLMATMLVGGLWHGAAWTVVLWGAMHGAMLVIHRLWEQSRFGARHAMRPRVATTVTFVCVLLAFVSFRAADLATMVEIYRGLFGFNGTLLGQPMWAIEKPLFAAALGTAGLLAVWALPNTQEWLASANPGLASPGYPATSVDARGRLVWRPDPRQSLAFALLLFTCFVKLNDVSPFIYFQF